MTEILHRHPRLGDALATVLGWALMPVLLAGFGVYLAWESIGGMRR